jgi:ubiquinol-cytochrome c reductase cytochrome c1 subunit
MIHNKTILGALLVAVSLTVAPVAAQEAAPAAEAAEPAHETGEAAASGGHGVEIAKQPWTFAGVFGTFDTHQLQRGFQVFKDVCASCHGMRLLAFRNLSESGGPEFSEDQVKALAATFDIADPDAEGGTRPGVAADRWPSPFATERDARDANGGALPPDLSVMAKARGTTQPFPWWILNYFTAYSEGGPDYIHALLTGYAEEVPHGTLDSTGKPFELPEGKYFNHVFPGYGIGMPPPLADGTVNYETGVPDDPATAGVDESQRPATLDEASRDVSAFLMWAAEPHLVARKEAGFAVMGFLFLFAVLMYLVKQKLWSRVEH